MFLFSPLCSIETVRCNLRIGCLVQQLGNNKLRNKRAPVNVLLIELPFDVASAWYYETPGYNLAPDELNYPISPASLNDGDIKFSPNGTTLAVTYSRNKEQSVNFYDYNAKPSPSQPSSRMATESATTMLAYAPDNSRLVTFSEHSIQLWNSSNRKDPLLLKKWEKGSNVKTIEEKPRNLAYDPKGKTFATCSRKARLEIFDVASQELIRSVDLRPQCATFPNCFGNNKDKPNVQYGGGTGCFVAYTADGKEVVTAVGEQNVKIWSIADGSLVQTLEHTYNHPDPSKIRKNQGDKMVDGELSILMGGLSAAWRAGGIGPVALSLDGKRMATGSNVDGAIYLWNITKTNGQGSGKKYALITIFTKTIDNIPANCRSHRCPLSDAAFSPDSNVLMTSWYHPSGVTTSLDAWAVGGSKASDFKLLRAWPVPVRRWSRLAWSVDGSIVALRTAEGVKLIQAGPCKRTQSFSKRVCNTFDLKKGTNRALRTSGRAYHDAAKPFGIDETYVLAPLEWDALETVPSMGSIEDIEYDVRSGDENMPLPDGLFMKTENGDIQVAGNGDPCKEFTLSVGNERTCASTGGCDGYTDPAKYVTPFFAVDSKAYKIAAKTVSRVIPSTGKLEDITYVMDAVSGNDADLPANLFLLENKIADAFMKMYDMSPEDRKSLGKKAGDMLVKFQKEDAGKTYNVRMSMEDAGGAKVALETISFAVRYRDTDEEMGPAALKLNGPGNDGCYNNGTMYEPEPINEFDNSYLCKCKEPSASCDADSEGDFTGPNCNVKDTTRAEVCAATAAEAATEAAASASETARAKKSLTGAIAAAVSVVMLVLVGFAAKRYYTYWLSIQ
eukprot:gene12759-21058_t